MGKLIFLLSSIIFIFSACSHGDYLESNDVIAAIDTRKMYIGNFNIQFKESGGDSGFSDSKYSIDTNINVEFFYDENEFVSRLPFYGDTPLKSFRMKYKIDSVNREMLFSFDEPGKLKHDHSYGMPSLKGNNGFITKDSINFSLDDNLNRLFYHLKIVGKRF